MTSVVGFELMTFWSQCSCTTSCSIAPLTHHLFRLENFVFLIKWVTQCLYKSLFDRNISASESRIVKAFSKKCFSRIELLQCTSYSKRMCLNLFVVAKWLVFRTLNKWESNIFLDKFRKIDIMCRDTNSVHGRPAVVKDFRKVFRIACTCCISSWKYHSLG